MDYLKDDFVLSIKNQSDWERKMLSSSGPIVPAENFDSRESGRRYNIGKARHDTKEDAEICLSCNKPNCKGWTNCFNHRKRELSKKKKEGI